MYSPLGGCQHQSPMCLTLDGICGAPTGISIKRSGHLSGIVHKRCFFSPYNVSEYLVPEGWVDWLYLYTFGEVPLFPILHRHGHSSRDIESLFGGGESLLPVRVGWG